MSNYPTALFRQHRHVADIKFIKSFKNKTVSGLRIKLPQMTKKRFWEIIMCTPNMHSRDYTVRQPLLYIFQVIQILCPDENLNWYHLCLFILSTNGVSQNAISPWASSARHERNTHRPSGMQLFSSLDLFVAAVTLMRSAHGLHSFDSSVWQICWGALCRNGNRVKA